MVHAPRPLRRISTGSAAFIVLSVLLFLGGYLYYTSEKSRIQRDMQEDLAAIADLKVSQILQWWEERKGDGEVLLVNRGLAQRAALALHADPGSPLRQEMVEWAEMTRQSFGYRSVILLDPEGTPCLGAGGDTDSLTEVTRLGAKEAARTRRVTTVDLHKGVGGHIALNVLTPLLAGTAEPSAVAVVLLRIDPAETLFPLVERWPTASATGESFLVRQEGEELVYLNELRNVQAPPMVLRQKLSTPGLLIAEGIRRQIGLVQGVDYRGVASIGVVRRVPGTPWYLVAKVDAEEVNRPVRERAWTMVLLLGLMLLTAGNTIALLGKRQQTRLYRRLYEAELEHQALVRHFDWLTRYANDVILLSDSGGRVVEANERALSAYGYSRDELVGLPLRSLLSPARTGDIERNHERARQSGGVIYETVHRRRDGTTFPVEVSTRVLEREGGAGWYTQDIIRDISERRAAAEDLSRTMVELERKNRELDAFTRTAAHDLRQPLTVVGGFIQYLRKQLASSLKAEQEKIFEQIQDSMSHMDRFLEDLLVLSRLESAPTSDERVPIAPLMAKIADYYSESLAECRGAWRVEEGLPDLLLPSARAREVFENLFSNSVKYCRSGVPLVVEVGVQPATAAAPAGQRVFTFRDNGKGIEPADQSRVFDLFYRAKEETVSGTGLGLAIVKGIVERTGGTIRIESIPGAGTTFYFSLPVAQIERGE